jgi:hypothetical protein
MYATDVNLDFAGPGRSKRRSTHRASPCARGTQRKGSPLRAALFVLPLLVSCNFLALFQAFFLAARIRPLVVRLTTRASGNWPPPWQVALDRRSVPLQVRMLRPALQPHAARRVWLVTRCQRPVAMRIQTSFGCWRRNIDYTKGTNQPRFARIFTRFRRGSPGDYLEGR